MRFLIFCCLLACSLFAKDKKILIFSCHSGGGHVATAEALNDFLHDQYDVVVKYPNDEIYPISTQLYCYHLSHGNHTLLNFNHQLMKVGFPLYSFFEDPEYSLIIEDYIEKEKPDLLISVVPFANHLCVEAANKYKIPFLIVTTDNDIGIWINGLKNKDLKRTHIAISRDLPLTKTFLLKNDFSLEQIEITGMAVRSDFYEPKNKAKLCSLLDLPLNKPKILVMFGASGSTALLDYVKKINCDLTNVHIIACAGKNEDVANSLKKVVLENGNSMTILGFTRKIANYMGASDLFITKAGPGTIEEAFLLKLPLLIDGTKNFLAWEKLNADLVVAYQVGAIVEDLEDLPDQIVRTLEKTAAIEASYQKMGKNEFPQKIKKVIDSMIRAHD